MEARTGSQPHAPDQPLPAEPGTGQPSLRTTRLRHLQVLQAARVQGQRPRDSPPSSLGEKSLCSSGLGMASPRPLTTDRALGSVDIISFPSSSTTSRARDLRTFLMGLRRSCGRGGRGRLGRARAAHGASALAEPGPLQGASEPGLAGEDVSGGAGGPGASGPVADSVPRVHRPARYCNRKPGQKHQPPPRDPLLNPGQTKHSQQVCHKTL